MIEKFIEKIGDNLVIRQKERVLILYTNSKKEKRHIFRVLKEIKKLTKGILRKIEVEIEESPTYVYVFVKFVHNYGYIKLKLRFIPYTKEHLKKGLIIDKTHKEIVEKLLLS